jgi:hypothetical protein
MSNEMLSMPSERTRLALTAILDNSRLAQTFTVGHTEETFAADSRTFYAVTRCLEIISEASRRLSPTLRERHPGLRWRAIIDVGKGLPPRLRHCGRVARLADCPRQPAPTHGRHCGRDRPARFVAMKPDRKHLGCPSAI